MNKKHVVRLTEDERARLTALVGTGRGAARTLAHARVLLKADEGDGGPGWADGAIAAAVEVSRPTVERVRRTLATEGLEAAPAARRPPSAPAPRRKLDREQEARLVALACSAPPEGRARWTLRLLAGRLVELEVVGGISPETVRAALKKTNSSRG